jgi:hypothetical protein
MGSSQSSLKSYKRSANTSSEVAVVVRSDSVPQLERCSKEREIYLLMKRLVPLGGTGPGFMHWAVRIGDLIHEAYPEGNKLKYGCCDVSRETDEQYPDEISIGSTNVINSSLKDAGEHHM